MTREPPARRVLRLIEAFGAATGALKLTELSHRAGLPLSTTHRMAGEFVRCGALEKSAAGYRIGARLRRAVIDAPHGLGVRELARPFVEDLGAATGKPVVLAMRQGRELVCDEYRPDGEAGCGRRRALNGTSAGLVLLAHAPPEISDGQRDLARVRRCGFAATPDGVAAPVHDGTGAVVAAIGVAGTARYVSAVVAVARGISRALGAKEAGGGDADP
ncbi:IclR family transcriptional regulator [Amycolatopsis acididurans]|uniref:IclR family transcriptional regulator n=1 Tax=Amycolatopsis acididurans TaxID=2724524 RepID=UPI0028A620F5|nr:helix-turn-helix domain-containing protein [Amycolatopsis acididurans]